MNTVTRKILAYNKNRVATLVKLKYAFIRQDVFRFYRGTCHLFYEALAKKINWKDDTRCWITGDLHLENFGTYKGDNGVVYFDMNDFDEALLAPATWELCRLLTSIHLAVHVLSLGEDMAAYLCGVCMDTYINALKNGKPVTIEKETATGLLKYFLETVKQRREKDFILSRMQRRKKQWKLVIDNKKTIALTTGEKEKIAGALNHWMDTHLEKGKFRVLDAAHRIAGTGSVGIQRYVLLVHEKKGNKFYLIDIKESKPSCLLPYSPYKQPGWENEAVRVLSLQKMVQHVSPAFLHTLVIGQTPFILKQLQPVEDRMDLRLCHGKRKDLAGILITMAQASASGQLRSGGRLDSSITDELVAFANNNKVWKKKVLLYASQYAKQVTKDYEAYCRDYDKGLE